VGIAPPFRFHFLAFNVKVAIVLAGKQNENSMDLVSHFILSSTAPGIHPHREPVTLQVGTFSIPPGSFKKDEHDDEEGEDGSFTFQGVIDGVRLKALIKRTGTLRYAFEAETRQLDLYHEPGAGEPDHRPRHGHDLDPGRHFPLKTRASRRDPVHLDRVTPQKPASRYRGGGKRGRRWKFAARCGYGVMPRASAR
jgi:hypothetical protein